MGEDDVNCYECAKDDREAPAIAICQNCGAGLCDHHAREDIEKPGPGGTSIGCRHDHDRAHRARV